MGMVLVPLLEHCSDHLKVEQKVQSLGRLMEMTTAILMDSMRGHQMGDWMKNSLVDEMDSQSE